MFLINWGELEGRTDVEFYVPSVLKYIERLKGMEHQKLLFISQKFANGSTPSEGKFEQTGVLYYRSQDIGLMEMQKKQYISEEFDEKLSRSRCRTGDVLVAIVGATLGRIGFIERDEQQGNINQNITKITISDLRFSPKFVAVFLDSKLGQIQLYRLSTKTAQSYLNNEQLGKVIIPTVCKSLQNDIVKAIEEAHQQAEKKKSEADELLNSINYYMLNALNIALPLKPCDDLANRIFYINANDMLGGRFDPRKYSLKYRKYYSTFMDVLKNSLGQSFTPKASFYIGESPLSVLVLSISENNNGNLMFFDNNKSTEQCLSQLDSLLTEERYNIYIRRNVRVYGKDSIYIVKPKQQKYWNYSSACRDADELFSDIMKAKG